MMGAHHQSTAKGTVVGICDGRVCIVTGAGRGIGREHSLMLAEQGAKVVVNDIGGEVDGSGRSTGPAQDVVDEIIAAGGEAVVNGDDISTWDGSERLVQQAIDLFGPETPLKRCNHICFSGSWVQDIAAGAVGRGVANGRQRLPHLGFRWGTCAGARPEAQAMSAQTFPWEQLARILLAARGHIRMAKHAHGRQPVPLANIGRECNQ